MTLEVHDQRFFQLNPCGHSPFRKPLTPQTAQITSLSTAPLLLRVCLMSRYLVAGDISVIMSHVASYILYVHNMECFQMWKETPELYLPMCRCPVPCKGSRRSRSFRCMSDAVVKEKQCIWRQAAKHLVITEERISPRETKDNYAWINTILSPQWVMRNEDTTYVITKQMTLNRKLSLYVNVIRNWETGI
jgi:hypothetical protein